MVPLKNVNLSSMPGPTAPRTSKLLELLQPLSATMTITRREAFLTTLIGDLSAMVVNHVSPHLTQALRVLCHLTRGSYIAAKTTTTFLPLEKLTTATYTQPIDQVKVVLILRLTSSKLSGECGVPLLQPWKNSPSFGAT